MGKMRKRPSFPTGGYFALVLGAALVQLSVMYSSKSVPLCNSVFHAVLQELTWSPQEHYVIFQFLWLPRGKKGSVCKISVFTYNAWIENVSNIPGIIWWGICLYVWPSSPGKLLIAKIKIWEVSQKTRKDESKVSNIHPQITTNCFYK